MLGVGVCFEPNVGGGCLVNIGGGSILEIGRLGGTLR